MWTAGKRGRRFCGGIHRVVDGIVYVSHTGRQSRCLPVEFVPWSRVWSQFLRCPRDGAWSRLLITLHLAVPEKAKRAGPTPSTVSVDTHTSPVCPSNGG
jgi:transposase